MRYIKIIILLFFTSIVFGQGIEPFQIQASPYNGGFLRSMTKMYDENVGDSVYQYVHVDSSFLSGFMAHPDSIYIDGDTIRLYNGTGFIKLAAGWGLDVATSGSTVTYKADTSELVTQDDISGLINGVTPRIPYYTSASALGTSVNLQWDNSNNELEVNTIPIGSNATGQLYTGVGAGASATSAIYSNLFGFNAGSGATSASYSNFFGVNAGYGATGAGGSNFIGNSAGNGATGANNSNFFGTGSGIDATNSYDSNLFGFFAGAYATNAFRSNFFGPNAGYAATNARLSNFFGLNAGQNATSADNSNFFGPNAGYGATNANNSNFFSNQAGYGATDASGSNFFGVNAGYGATNANNSNFFGNQAGFLATGATSSNFFGNGSGSGATNATYSNLFGINVGKTFTGNNLGTNNIIIGNNISLPNARSNSINLGGVLFGSSTYSTTTGDPSITASSGGKIGIMTVTPLYTLDVTGDIRLTDRSGTPQFNLAHDSNGKIVSTGVAPTSGTVTSIATTSPITGGTITSTGTIGITQSTTSTSGFLSSTDWNTFNGKVGGSGTSNYMTKFTGTSTIGNSIMQDDGATIGVNIAPDASYRFKVGDGNMKIGHNTPGTLNKLYFGDGTFVFVGEDVADDRLYLKGTSLSINTGGSLGSSGQVITSNGTTASWSTPADGSATNEGYLGISTSGGTKIRGYNSSGTATGNGVGVTASNGVVVASGGDNTNGGDLTWQLSGQASAVHNLGSNGLIARTSSGNVSARTITAGTGISVSNGDGVSANPTISTNQSVNYGAIYNSSFYSESWTTGTPKKITMSSTSASSGVSISSSVLTTSSAGDYEISYSLGLQHTSFADWYCACYNSSGSSSYGQTWTTSRRDGASLRSTLSMTTIVPLSSGDTISLWCYPDSGSGNDSVFYPKLSIKRIN